MKKVIVLSAVLGLSALGMACGDSAANNAPANKPVVVANVPAAVSNAANVAANAAQVASNAASQVANAIKPATNAPVGNMKPAPAMNANVKK